jgi:multiple sugar transport system substrate-binding protein
MVYKDGSVVPPGNQSDFFAGDAAMTMAQVSRISKLEGASFNWGMVTIPKGPAGEVPVIGQAAICANAKSKNGSLAAELVAYMTSKSCVERMAGIWPPARKSVLTSDAFLNSNSAVTPEQMKDTVATSINNGKVLPSHRLYPQIEVESKMVWDKLWNANADVASVLDEVATVYKKYIK